MPSEPSGAKPDSGTKPNGDTIGDQVASSPADGVRYVYERVCTANVGDYLDPATCVELDARCTGGEDGILVQWIEVDTSTSPPTETPTGRQDCLYSGQPPEPPAGGDSAGDEPVVITLREFESQPIVAAQIVSQPEHFGLKNAHSNVYAVAEEQQFTFEFEDAQIRLRAWPVSYRWNYGDGTGQTTTTGGTKLDVGAMNTETATSHRYTETGDYNVSLVTYFAGDYSVDGGPWRPVAGEAAVPSDPHLMSIWTSETSLYADNCIENPNGAGC
ncbi:PKD domain-containing protein [Arthrobacter castelli]|uniref:PKD domain-containing protein n=1 Tax=Arthrobacter castelli TaxID=271431 RepID=UPI00138ABDC6|nr:PKD domain-containing protein [Arthrobacter castelli]